MPRSPGVSSATAQDTREVTVQLPDNAQVEDGVVIVAVVTGSTAGSLSITPGYSILRQGVAATTPASAYFVITTHRLTQGFSNSVTLTLSGRPPGDWVVGLTLIRNPEVGLTGLIGVDAATGVASGGNAVAPSVPAFTEMNSLFLRAYIVSTDDGDRTLSASPNQGALVVEEDATFSGAGLAVLIARQFFPNSSGVGAPQATAAVTIGGTGTRTFAYVGVTIQLPGPVDDTVTSFSTLNTIHEGQRSVTVGGLGFAPLSGDEPSVLLSNSPTRSAAVTTGAGANSDRQTVRHFNNTEVVFNAVNIENLKPGFAYIYVDLPDGYSNNEGLPFVFEHAADAPNFGVSPNVFQEIVGATDIAHKLERFGLISEGLEGHPPEITVTGGFSCIVNVAGLGAFFTGRLDLITIYVRLRDAKTGVIVAEASAPYTGDITTQEINLVGDFLGEHFSIERTYFLQYGAEYFGTFGQVRHVVPPPADPVEISLAAPLITEGLRVFTFAQGPSEETEGPVSFSRNVQGLVYFNIAPATQTYDAIWQVTYGITGSEFTRQPHEFAGGVATQNELYTTQMQVLASSQVTQGVATGLVSAPDGVVPLAAMSTAEISVGLPGVADFFTNPGQYEFRVLLTDFEEYLASPDVNFNLTLLFDEVRTLNQFGVAPLTISGLFSGGSFSPERTYALVFTLRNRGGAILAPAGPITSGGGLELGYLTVNGAGAEVFEYIYGGAPYIESNRKPSTGGRFLEHFVHNFAEKSVAYGLGQPEGSPDDIEFTIRHLLSGYQLQRLGTPYGQADLSGITAGIADIETAVATVDTEVEAVQATASAIQTAVAVIDTEVEAVQATTMAIGGAVTAVGTAVEAIEAATNLAGTAIDEMLSYHDGRTQFVDAAGSPSRQAASFYVKTWVRGATVFDDANLAKIIAFRNANDAPVLISSATTYREITVAEFHAETGG